MRHWRVLTFVSLLALGACNGGSDHSKTVAGHAGVEALADTKTVFEVGPAADVVFHSSAEEPATFVYKNLVYSVHVAFDVAPSDRAPCTVDGSSSAYAFSIGIVDATGRAYRGPITIRAEAIPRGAAAHLAIGDVCTRLVTFDAWSGRDIFGSVSIADEPPEDRDGAGAIGLRLRVTAPGAKDVVIVPGRGAISHDGDTLSERPSSPPALGDHWHAAYGVYLCDHYEPPLSDAGQDTLGIHTHSDGLVHIHPFATKATGDGATLGKFAVQVGLVLEDRRMTLPDGRTFRDGGDCGAGRATLRLVVWDSVNDTSPRTISKGLGAMRFESDGMVVAIVYAPLSESPQQPPSVKALAHPADVAG